MPGAADRILVMAEHQSKHRQNIEKWSIIGDQLRSMAGLLFGLIISLVIITGSVYLILSGKQVSGLLLGGGMLVSLVGSFIYGSRQKQESLENAKEAIE